LSVLPEETSGVEASLWGTSKASVLIKLGNGGTIDCRRDFCYLICWWRKVHLLVMKYAHLKKGLFFSTWKYVLSSVRLV
jgi:hypothetical protein